MPRDTPPIALPALAFFEDAAAGDTLLRTGGLPRLPEGIDWPLMKDGTPFHFFAEVDLARLPRHVEASGETYPLPRFPEHGRLFVFLPLTADHIYGTEPAVVYAPDATHETPFRTPPKDLAPLDEEESGNVFDVDRLTKDRRGFCETRYETRPIMSARAENPLWRNMDRAELSEEEVYERDLAFAKQLQALGIDYEVPLPSPEATREALYDDIPYYYQGFFQRGVFQWTWEYIFEVSKRAYAACYGLGVEEIESWLENGEDHPRMHRVMARLKGKQDKIEAETFSGRSGWWERYACDHVPSLDMRVDVQLARWMGYARVRRDTPLTDDDKRAFIALLAHVETLGKGSGIANLRALTQFREHGVKSYYVGQEVTKAFKRVAQECAHLHPGRDLEPKHDFGDDARAAQNVQMFGAGYLMQHAAVENEDKVLLFQISNGGGLTLGEIDGILQLWIAHDDLAEGRFSAAFATMETT